MKKYVKPDLLFESFQLNHHIAACAYDQLPAGQPGHATTIESCAFKGDVDMGMSPETIFLETTQACNIKLDGGTICYSGWSDETEPVLPPILPGGGGIFNS